MVLNGLVSDNLHFGRVCDFERTDFRQVSLWGNLVDFKGLISDNFDFWRVWWL